MELVAKALALWFVCNLERCSNSTEVIMSRCLATYAIMKGKPIHTDIDSSDSRLGHQAKH
ncbi:hypothetical protein A2U01_0000890 [Trifolium medium]|uniref:Uncharacterized protein n=1 Tax=Trifolium medium TaxID=97028 RepID=A0A392LZG8_9FABA|nr:hypothetical protein [Trifolium medium]